MMPSPEITVIGPTFDRPAQLAEALESVFAQNVDAIEAIVVDDSPESEAGRPDCASSKIAARTVLRSL
jgi:hypothetical protein